MYLPYLLVVIPKKHTISPIIFKFLSVKHNVREDYCSNRPVPVYQVVSIN